MSVSPVNGYSTLAASLLSTAQSSPKSPFDSVSSLLGMSAQDIASQVKSGKSLDELAQAKGISHADLVSAIKAGMPDDLKNSGKADQVAERIATQKGEPTRGTHRTGGPSGLRRSRGDGDGDGDDTGTTSSSASTGSATGVLSGNLTAAQKSMLEGLSTLLDTDTSTLTSQLQSGTSLADLVTGAGLDSASLAGVLSKGLLVDTSA